MDAQGEMLELKNTINAMVDQLNGFISEVTRVAREVGTEGKLGQAAAVTIEVGGVWKDLTDNVNLMARNLTGQVRNIAEVTTAVANGDLSKKISIDVQGEFLELKNTVNAMVDQLNAFAGEVTRVAREVGVEGKLGGQAQSKEVAGVWKDLTDNVNQLAANLTNQVRAISDVATAVTEGDLTRQVGVEASGEVAVLKDKLNEMIRNLRETTRVNTEQDWLKTNLERFTRMLQGQRDLSTVSDMILSELAPLVSAQHGVLYTMGNQGDGGEQVLRFQAAYGYEERKHLSNQFAIGEGLVGQCAKERRRVLMTDVPTDYIRITSGLGDSTPLNIIVLPVLFEGSVRAVIELASFSRFSETHQAFLDHVTESIGLVLNTIEDKAEQRAIASKYKSEFLASMSHELRTPLNSLLILAEQLQDNPTGNLTAQQVEYASIIRSSGSDLLTLLNDILDLAKVESGTVRMEMTDVAIEDLRDSLVRDFAHVAASNRLDFHVDVDDGLPATITTDSHRLRQVLKNLLSNAFKFTERGHVTVHARLASSGWSRGNASLDEAGAVIAFVVTDSGIGIAQDKQRPIFEAFAQANGAKYGTYRGTGLGLSISRELVQLLGGEITLTSALEQGSVFTVYLPMDAGAARRTPVVAPARTWSPQPTTFAVAVAPQAREASTIPAVKAIEAPAPVEVPGYTALVVDDDYRNVIALTALLERGGMTVVGPESGNDALAILQSTSGIDIVFMDIMMPVMDGYDTMRAVRALPQFADLPIVAVTAKAMPDEEGRCIEAGASSYVPTPVGQARLLLAVGQWLPREFGQVAPAASGGRT